MSVIQIHQLKDRDFQSEFFKKDSIICCLQETNFKQEATDTLKLKGQEKTYDTNTNQKKARAAV